MNLMRGQLRSSLAHNLMKARRSDEQIELELTESNIKKFNKSNDRARRQRLNMLRKRLPPREEAAEEAASVGCCRDNKDDIKQWRSDYDWSANMEAQGK